MVKRQQHLLSEKSQLKMDQNESIREINKLNEYIEKEKEKFKF